MKTFKQLREMTGMHKLAAGVAAVGTADHLQEILGTQKKVFGYGMKAATNQFYNSYKTLLTLGLNKKSRRAVKNRVRGLQRVERKVKKMRTSLGVHPDGPFRRPRKKIKLLGLLPAVAVTAGVLAHGLSDDAGKLVMKDTGGYRNSAARQLWHPRNLTKYGSALGDALSHPNLYKSRWYKQRAELLKSQGKHSEAEEALRKSKKHRDIANVKEERMSMARHADYEYPSMDLHLKKGAFHRWLGKSEDEEITQTDIRKGLASDDAHVRKMANFAANARRWSHVRKH